MRVERWSLADVRDAGGPSAVVKRLRELIETPELTVTRVREIVNEVRNEGDKAVLRLTSILDTLGDEPRPLLVPPAEMDEAIKTLPLDVVAGLQVAIANVAEVAQLSVGEDSSVTLPQGQSVLIRELPVESTAVYVPGGRAPYPSTAIMGVVTARAAGVLNVAVCSPPGPSGQIDPLILGTCRLLGVERVYRMGGAQAIAALAYGTETVRPVDVIVGPGNLWVQEAKREVAGWVGIDGFAGPSELMVLLGEDADTGLAALDLLAQVEHGTDGGAVAVSSSKPALDALDDRLKSLSAERPGEELAQAKLIEVADARAGIELANALAPEHLQLIGAEPESLAPLVRNAGCLFVGASAATAFGDYVAGSNHILPTGSAARFASGLSPRHFRRRMAEVRLGEVGGETVGKLAKAGAPIARAEGFEWHARSMEARMVENQEL